MRRKQKGGITGVSLPVFVRDSTSTTGAGLAGLAFNTAGLVAEYRRQGQSAWTAISLAAGTLGTWSSGGFIVDGALAGAYELGLPDAAVAAGARWVLVRLRGAASMLAVTYELELDQVDYQDGAAFGLSSIPRLLGLLRENSVLDDLTYDGAGNLTAANLYVYDTAAHALAHVAGGGNQTGLLFKYALAGTITGGNLALERRTRTL